MNPKRMLLSLAAAAVLALTPLAASATIPSGGSMQANVPYFSYGTLHGDSYADANAAPYIYQAQSCLLYYNYNTDSYQNYECSAAPTNIRHFAYHFAEYRNPGGPDYFKTWIYVWWSNNTTNTATSAAFTCPC